MKIHLTLGALAVAATGFTVTPVAAANTCIVAGDPFDLDDAGVHALYDCIKDEMAAAYAKEGHEVGSVFRDWAPTATRPALPGIHGERFLNTFVNDTGAEEYLKFATEGVHMPAGSIIAKESIQIGKGGKASVGPLFIMTKLDAGGAPEFGDWLYGGVQPNGKVMNVSQQFCHDCHVAYEDQDALGYPLEEVRIGAPE